jgi:hypothetical protein
MIENTLETSNPAVFSVFLVSSFYWILQYNIVYNYVCSKKNILYRIFG